MNNNYIEFLYGYDVINVPNEQEFLVFLNLMKKLGIQPIAHTENLYNKYGFEKAFCYNAGLRRYPNEDLCFSFHFEHGFVPSSKSDYSNGEDGKKIVSVNDIINATNFHDKSKLQFEYNPINDKPVDVICNDYLTTFESREIATDFYYENMCATEGAESERYCTIFMELEETNKKMVTDDLSNKEPYIWGIYSFTGSYLKPTKKFNKPIKYSDYVKQRDNKQKENKQRVEER